MILAGDIGGTNARLALFDVQNGQFNLVAATIFPSRRYSSLDKIVTEFVRTSGVRPAQACFGVAGPVTNGRVETSNLPWTIESRRLADELNLKNTTLINDLEATGWGIAALSPDDLVPLNSISAKSPGNQAIVAAGTGLGEGGLYWDGARHHVFATEGGHCDFAPLNQMQVELFNYLHARYGHVSYERVLSGPGLVNVFEFLRDTGKGKVPEWLAEQMLKTDPAAAVSEAAMEGKCAMCAQALDIFVSVFGAEAGNLALKLKATGGVFLAGGIAPKILPRLATPIFLQAFLGKGRMQHLMELMPIKVITNDKLALLGAARCALVEAA
jgi:glucokinase